jgi:hypothetical protein
MNRKRIVSIMGFSFILLFISFTFGYQFMKSQLKQTDNINNPSNVVEQNDPLGVEIVREDNRISPNTFIEERIHYKACDHLIS